MGSILLSATSCSPHWAQWQVVLAIARTTQHCAQADLSIHLELDWNVQGSSEAQLKKYDSDHASDAFLGVTI